MKFVKIWFLCLIFLYFHLSIAASQVKTIKSSDLYKMRSVKDAEISPDGSLIAYTVVLNPTSGRTTNQLWVIELGNGKSLRLTGEKDSGSGPVWSPD